MAGIGKNKSMRLQLKAPVVEWIKILSICLMVPAIFFLHANSLKLWFDETVQLSSAHLANAETLESYRYEIDPGRAMEWNRNYNMDPGGYTLFLNLLSPVVKHRFYLYRIINIAAFILGLALMLRWLSIRCGRKPSASSLLLWSAIYLLLASEILQQPLHDPLFVWLRKWMPFVPFLQSGLSIRAYGFEFLFVSLLFCTSDWWRSYQPSRYILMACLILLGLGLRYDYALFVFSFLAASTVHLVQRGDLQKALRFPYTWLVFSSALLGVFLIFILSYIHQMGGEMSPMKMKYISYAYLNSMRKLIAAFKYPMNLLAFLFFLFTLWWAFTSRALFIDLLYCILFFLHLVLTLKGFYPFDMSLDRCLAMITTFDIIFLYYVSVLLKNLFSTESDVSLSLTSLIRGSELYVALAATAISLWVVYGSYVRHGDKAFIDAITSKNEFVVDSVISGVTEKTVMMDRHATPNIKAYYQLRRKTMPKNKYVCILAGPHGRNRWYVKFEDQCAYPINHRFDFLFVPILIYCNDLRTYLSGPSFESISNEKTLYRRK